MGGAALFSPGAGVGAVGVAGTADWGTFSADCVAGWDAGGLVGINNRDPYKTARERRKAKRIRFSIGNLSMSKDRIPRREGDGIATNARPQDGYLAATRIRPAPQSRIQSK